MTRLRIQHYQTESGRDRITEFLEGLSALERAACEEVIGFLESGEIDDRPRHRDYLGDGIWELRVSIGRAQFRILYTVERGVATLLVGFHKKTPQTPKRHLDIAKRRQKGLR